MGIAEVVPGVSGGTIAFVSGIYQELVATLAGLSKQSPLDFFRDPAGYWRERNLSFLLVLGFGMVCGILAFAHLLKVALSIMAPVVWAFFFGLILASVWYIGSRRSVARLATFGVGGLIAGLLLTQLPTAGDSQAMWLYFLGGVIAVCAWLLPAVSGSFMLLALGLYAPVLAAVSDLNLPVLATVAAGCAVGLLLFARLLSWLLQRYEDALLALLSGFMLGALANLWPWRLDGSWHLPDAYAATGHDPFISGVLLACLAGVLALLGLVRLDR